MRKLFRPKPRDPKVPSPGLEPARVILTFVASLGEGPVSVPGLKAAAQIVIKIIEIAQTVQSNQADCLIIAERAQQLMEAMIESLGNQKESNIHPRLKEDLTRFESDLKGILEILEAQANPSRIARVFKHAEHSQELLQAKEMLDHSFRRFQVYNTIAIRLGVDDIVRGQSQKAYHADPPDGDGMSATERATRVPQVEHVISLFDDVTQTKIAVIAAPVDVRSKAKPFFRVWSGRDHFYTMDVDERDRCIKQYGWSDEGISCLIFPTQTDSSEPLFRTWNTANGDHFYTTDIHERDNAINNLRFNIEGQAGFVFKTQVPESVPLYRLVGPNDHFYTVDASERDRAIQNFGYASEGTACFVFEP